MIIRLEIVIKNEGDKCIKIIMWNIGMAQGGVHKGVSVTLNMIMMLTQDPPSPSLNDNLSITVDHLTSKLKILQIIMWNIGMAQKAKETRSGCLVHIVQ